MSSRPVHEAASSRNAATTAALLAADPEHPWAVTTLFYIAVQLVEAALADFGDCSDNHGDRYARLHSRWGPSASAPFVKLKQASERWRYRGISDAKRDIALAETWARDLARAVDERWPA